jgi:hypothetical protein
LEKPNGKIFVYNRITFERIPFEIVDELTLKINEPFREVVVDYSYNY